MLPFETISPEPGSTPTAATTCLPRPAPLPPALAWRGAVLRFLKALHRRWLLGACLGVTAALGTAAAFLLLLPALYSPCTAQALLRVNADPGSIVALVKSRFILDDALRKDEVRGLDMLAEQPDPVEFLRDNLEVDFSLGSEVVRIALSGDRPEKIATIVNAVARTAVEKIGVKERLERDAHLAKLAKAQETYQKELKEKQERLAELSLKAGGTEHPHLSGILASMAAMRLSARHAELVRTENALLAARQQRQALKDRPADSPEKPAPAPTVEAREEDSPTGTELQPVMAQWLKVKQEVVQLGRIARTPADAERMIRDRGLDRELKALEAQFAEFSRKTSSPPPVVPEPVVPPGTLTSGQLDQQINILERTQKTLQDEIAELTRRAEAIKTSAAEIERLQKDIEVYEDLARNVSGRLETLRLQQGAPDRVEEIELADVPRMKAERRIELAALAGLGAFGLVIFGVGVVEVRKRKVYSARDVCQGLGVPVVGTHRLPTVAGGDGQTPWYTLPDDCVDATRAVVADGAVGTSARTILVASAVGGEGSTSVAVRLAASLARSGRRTLLIDANLRRPAANKPFGLPEAPGLSEVLRGEVATPAAVRAAPLDRLWLLAAGQADLRAQLALSREKSVAVLDLLKRDYDFLVIDGAPVVSTPDALLIAQRADVVLLTVLCGVSRLPAVYQGWQRLGAVGARRRGIVVQGDEDDVAVSYTYAPPMSA